MNNTDTDYAYTEINEENQYRITKPELIELLGQAEHLLCSPRFGGVEVPIKMLAGNTRGLRVSALLMIAIKFLEQEDALPEDV